MTCIPPLILSSNRNDFTTFLNEKIVLDQSTEYNASLLCLYMYNSFPNITEENNKFKYFNGNDWRTIAIDTGSYEVISINDEIQRQMINNGDYNKTNEEFYINIFANSSKLNSVVDITNASYKVDFTIANSIGSVLGFNAKTIEHGYNESDNIVNIMKINSILVHTDIISGSYVNGVKSSVIYSFFPNVPPGFKIVERPNPSLIPCPVHKKQISSIRIWLTDQDNNPVDTRGEKMTVQIQITEIKNIKQEIVQAIKELKKENIL